MTIFGQEGGASHCQLMMESLVSKLSPMRHTCDNLCKYQPDKTKLQLCSSKLEQYLRLSVPHSKPHYLLDNSMLNSLTLQMLFFQGTKSELKEESKLRHIMLVKK